MDEVTRTSLHALRLLCFDNAATRRRWEGARCPVQQMICNHTDLPVGLMGRPVGGQATARNAGRPTVKCELRWGVSAQLTATQGKQPLRACCGQCAHSLPISRIDNRDTRTKTRICFDNRFFDYRLTCLLCCMKMKKADWPSSVSNWSAASASVWITAYSDLRRSTIGSSPLNSRTIVLESKSWHYKQKSVERYFIETQC